MLFCVKYNKKYNKKNHKKSILLSLYLTKFFLQFFDYIIVLYKFINIKKDFKLLIHSSII